MNAFSGLIDRVVGTKRHFSVVQKEDIEVNTCETENKVSGKN